MIEVRIHVEPLDELSQRERLSMLRGQLTLIVRRAENAIPVSVESLERAERVARELEQAA